MHKIELSDAAPLQGVRKTNDGYLVADVRVARTGVQDYLGSELDPDNEIGLRDKGVVRLFRPEEEVFSKDSVHSYAHRPVTNDHPSVPVSADNWRDLAIGQTGDQIVRDGEWVRVSMVVMDGAAVRDIEAGKRQLSMGYSFMLDATPGVLPDGTEYDGVQRELKMNHLAVVAAARAGALARIGDRTGGSPITTEKEDNMSGNNKTVVLGDKAVQVLDTDVAVVEAYKAGVAAAAKDAEANHKKEVADLQSQIGTLKVDLKKAEDAALKPQDIEALVAERTEIEKVAQAVDSKIVVKGRTNDQIRKDCVVSVLGADMVASASDAEIVGMFKAVSRDAKITASGQEDLRRGFDNNPLGSASAGEAKAVYDAALRKSVVSLNAHRNK